MNFSRSEKETTIQYDLESNTAKIFTRIEKDINRLDKLCKEYPDEYKCVERHESGNKYECTKRYITFRKPVKRELTEEQKEKLRERLKEMRNKK